MFGKNQVTAPRYRADGALQVHSVFHTIQGEGPRSGEPAVFVRLAGCNLRCWFCDTDFEHGRTYTVQELWDEVARVSGAGTRLVVLTGGEPLAQQVLPFVEAVSSGGRVVQVETAGTCYVPPVRHLSMEMLWRTKRLEIVCSPKTPRLHPQLIPIIGAYKYIVRSGEIDSEDGLPRFSTQRKDKPQRLFRPPEGAPVFLSPMDEQSEESRSRNAAVAASVCMRHGYRLSLQVHKLIGVP